MSDSTPPNLLFDDGDEPWIINQMIFDALNDYLRPATTLSPADAANAIDQLFPLNRRKEDEKENEAPESFLLEMWGVVIRVAEQIPLEDARQAKLVEFLQALRDLPHPRTVNMDLWGEMVVWSDLPLLGLELSETFHVTDLEDTSDAQQAIRSRQKNFIAFTARLTARGIADRAKYQAIPYLRMALEEEPDHRAKAYLKQGPGLDLNVPLAAIWIRLAGDVIFAHCRSSLGGGSDANLRERGRNWKGENGFSLERWGFWKKRFGEIKHHNQPSQKTREIAADAEEAMNTIEY